MLQNDLQYLKYYSTVQFNQLLRGYKDIIMITYKISFHDVVINLDQYEIEAGNIRLFKIWRAPMTPLNSHCII